MIRKRKPKLLAILLVLAVVLPPLPVLAAEGDSFDIEVMGDVVAGEAFVLQITAMNEFGLPDTEYTGDHTITCQWTAINSPDGDLPTLPPAGVFTFTEGVALVGGFIAVMAGQELTITVTDETGITGSIEGVAVLPGATASFDVDVPAEVIVGDYYDFVVTSKDLFGNTSKDLEDVVCEIFAPGDWLYWSGNVILQDGTGMNDFYVYGDYIGTNRIDINGLESASFEAVLGPVQWINIVGGNGQSAQAGEAFPESLVVEVLNSNGYQMAGIPVTFTAPASGAGCTFGIDGPVTVDVLTDDWGFATVSDCISKGIGGYFDVIASCEEGAVSATFSLLTFSDAGSVYINTTDSVPYDTIGGAVVEAISGDTVIVGPGVYQENVVIDKALTLTSQNGPKSAVIFGGEGACVEITGSGPVLIEGMVLNSGTQGILASAPELDSLDLTLTENEIRFNGAGGVQLLAMSQIQVEMQDNVISENQKNSAKIDGFSFGGAVRMMTKGEGSTIDAVIRGNEFAGNEGGGIRIGWWDDSNNALYGNVTADISENTFIGNESGTIRAKAVDTLDVNIADNIFSGYISSGGLIRLGFGSCYYDENMSDIVYADITDNQFTDFNLNEGGLVRINGDYTEVNFSNNGFENAVVEDGGVLRIGHTDEDYDIVASEVKAVIRGNDIQNVAPEYGGVFRVAALNLVDADVQDNVVTGNAGGAIRIGTWCYYRDLLAASVKATVKGNILDQNDAFGIYIDASETLEGTVSGNYITNTETCGSEYEGAAIQVGAPATSNELIINYNTMENNDYGLLFAGTGPLEASLNHWGDQTGPDGGDIDGSGDRVVGEATVEPWITSAAYTPDTLDMLTNNTALPPITLNTLNAAGEAGSATAPDGSIRLLSGNTGVVSVLPGNTLKAVGPGTAVITANIANKPTLAVTVSDAPVRVNTSGRVSPTPSVVKLIADGKTMFVDLSQEGRASVPLQTFAGRITNGSTVTVEVVPFEGVSSYGAELPSYALSGSGKGTLSLNTELGDFTLPSDMLAGSGLTGQAGIAISKGDKENLPVTLQDAIGDRPLIQLTFEINGIQIPWSNPDAPVLVSIPYTPSQEELENPDAIVIWYLDGEGEPVCVPNGRYDAESGKVTFSTSHFSDYAVAFNPVQFTDVAVGAWFETAVQHLAARDIIAGTGQGLFSPDRALTRAESLVLAMRAYGIAPDGSSADNFDDAGDTYYTAYLAAAKRLGLSKGVGGNLFAPSREITRQELCTLLYGILKEAKVLSESKSGQGTASFTDTSSIAPWAEEAMLHFAGDGVIQGSNGMLSPEGMATRAQIAQMLYRLLDPR